MKIKKFKKIKSIAIRPSAQPNIDPISPKLYKLEETWAWYWWVDLKKNETALLQIRVKKGFKADGQSSPRFAYPILRFRPDGIVRAAALVHDAIYRNKGVYSKGFECYLNSDRPKLSRKTADQIYKVTYMAAIRGCGIRGREKRRAVRKAKMGYVILRMFGWIYWGSKKPPRER